MEILKNAFNKIILWYDRVYRDLVNYSTRDRGSEDSGGFKKVRRLIRDIPSLILIIIAFILRFRRDGLVDALLITAIILDIISIILEYRGGERISIGIRLSFLFDVWFP